MAPLDDDTARVLAERLLSRIRRLLRAGRAAETLPMLGRLARVPGRAADAAAAQAETFLALGHPDHAEAAATCAIAVAADPALLTLRAEIRLARRNHRGAMVDAAEAVISDPASPRAKSALGRAMLEDGRFEDAILLLEQAVLAFPADAAVRTALSRASAATGRSVVAEGWIASAEPSVPPGEVALAAVQPLTEGGDAAALADRMAPLRSGTDTAASNHQPLGWTPMPSVEAPRPAQDAKGLLDDGIAALKAGDPERAIHQLEQSVAANRDPHAVLNLGLALAQAGRMSDALPHLEDAARALPLNPEPRFHLGRMHGLRGDAARAARDFRAALALQRDHVPSLAALAALEEDAGRWNEAASFIAAARAAAPWESELAFAAGRLALRCGNPATALADAAAALTQRPAHAGAARLYAEAALALHGAEAALALIAERADAEPFAASWPVAAAVLLGDRGDAVAALAELRLAEALAPDEGGILAALGRALAGTDTCGEAATVLRAAVARCPADLDLRNLLATVLWKAHRLTPMLDVMDTAEREFGPHPTLLLNRSLALNASGDQNGALAAADAAIAAGGGLPALSTRLVILPYHPREGTAAGLRRAAGEVAASLAPVPPRPRPAAPDPGKHRLRVGLLSGGLGQHPVGWLTVAGIEALPRDEFECVAYSLKRRADPIADRFRARCALWRDMERASDNEIADAIAADGVDILLDLGGYGEGGRPFALASRPAPVQIKWVGAQFGTTGLPYMDGMLTDRWETPPGHEPHYSERLLRLPDGYVCYSPPPYAPAVAPLPALAAGGRVTFGCFNNLAKVTEPVLLAWRRILEALPEARLALRTHALDDPEVRAAVGRRMAASGLPLERIDLGGSLPHRDLLDAYNAVDIALDPFPYTGGLTVCEALWMGVPVLSLAGDSFCGRHALSHLSNVGLPEWAVGTPDAYVREALRHASDLGALASLRAGLRARMRASPLCDAPRFGASLAEVLHGAWRDRCSTEEAATVPPTAFQPLSPALA